MTEIFRGLPGSGINSFISEFKEVLKASPFKTFLIAPTRRFAKLIEDQMLQGSIKGINRQSIGTFQDFIKDLYKRYGGSKLLLNNTDLLLVIHHLLKIHSKEFNIIVNSELGTISNYGAELLSFLSSIYSYNADYPECLIDLQSPKSAELANFIKLYEEYLEENKLMDDRGLTRWAIDYIQHNQLPHIDNLFIYGIFDPAPLQKQLLEVLVRNVPGIRYFEPYGTNKKIFGFEALGIDPHPVMLESDRAWETTLEKNLYNFEDRKIEIDYSVEVFSTRDSLSELRKIASMIKTFYKEGTSLGSIAVVFPSIGLVAGLIREVFEDFGIPVDISIPIPLAQSQVVRAVLDLLEVPSSNYELHAVLRLVDSAYFSFARIGSESIGLISSRSLKRFAIKANSVRGEDQWIERLRNLRILLKDKSSSLEDDEKTKKRLDREIEVLDRIILGLESLFGQLSKLLGQKTVAEHANDLIQLLDRLDINRNIEFSTPDVVERDQIALGIFIEILDSLQESQAVISDGEISYAEFTEVLRTLVNTAKFRAQRRNRNRVQAVGPRELIHLHFDIVFLGGLVEGAFPRTLTTQYYITEDEGELIGLLGKKGLLRQERFYFLNTLLSPRKLLVLSHPKTVEGRTTIPSVFLDEIKRLISYSDIDASFEEQSLLVALRRAGERIKERSYTDLQILAAHPLGCEEIIRRVNIEAFERIGIHDSEFDGYLEVEEDIVTQISDQFGENATFSSTKLETYAQCPFRFFLRYIVGLKEPEELAEGFDPKERGSLIHRILYAFFAERAEQGLKRIENAEKAKMRVREIAEQEFLGVPYRGIAWEAQRQLYIGEEGRYGGILGEMIDYEAGPLLDKFQPAHFEMEIGNPRKRTEVSKNSLQEPIRLSSAEDLLNSFLFEGYIDRIDLTEDGKFAILDYKTGSLRDELQAILDGQSFQLPLYLLATEKKLDLVGVAGSYYVLARPSKVKKHLTIADKDYKRTLFPKARGKGLLDHFRVILDQSVIFALNHINSIRGGYFAPNSDLDECPKYCEYRVICRHEPMRALGIEGES